MRIEGLKIKPTKLGKINEIPCLSQKLNKIEVLAWTSLISMHRTYSHGEEIDMNLEIDMSNKKKL